MSEFQDKLMACSDCGENYVWSDEEQEMFKQKGCEPPKRCKPCRQARKARRGD